MQLHFRDDAPSSAAVDLLAVGLSPQGALSAELGAFGEALRAALQAEEVTGDTGRSQAWPTFGQLPARRVVVVGLGDGSPEALRRAAGLAGQAARAAGDKTVALAFGPLEGAGLTAAYEGYCAGNYRDDRYRAESARKAPTAELTLLGVSEGDLRLAKAVADGQELARALVNAPAEELYPETLADIARGLEADGLQVEVWDEQQIRAAGMGGISAVGQGSDRPARFIHIRYIPAGAARKRLGIIGKGVTFDSGGLSLKTPDGMLTMRCDMAGSAAVVGVMKAIAALKPDVEVHGIIGAVENMLGGRAYKLGDVLRMHNGKTVEVHNTDAEGRLVLGDCLSYASGLGLDAMVDIATLTGACVVALGDLYSALYSHQDDVADSILAAAKDGGELVWRMPLEVAYKERLKADFATMKNVGGPPGGSITAALFLSEFVGSTPWAHLDIAGPAFFSKTTRHYAPGGTGCMVPTLTRWLLA
ncbi:MAG: leucyl aminopeptidase [Deltaproteobacteria bacterium]|nr:leucyl aminopeptidase [Deltaproteobacteria bacterium]